MIITKKRSLLLLLLLVIFFVTGCSYSHTFNTARELNRKDAKEFIINQSVAGPLKEIRIDTRLADIELLPGDDYYVEIDYLYWEEAPEYSVENGVLIFDDEDTLPESYSIHFKLSNVIRVYLPKDTLTDLIDVSTDSGNIDTEGFLAKKVDLATSYGNLSIKNAAAVNAEVVLSSGNSTIKDFNAGTLNYTNSYGKAEFTNINTTDTPLPDGSAYDSFKATLSSGNLNLEGMRFPSASITDSYGDISCEDILIENLNVNLSSGNLKLSKADVLEADLKNSYGNVDVTLVGTESDYQLDLDTSYGSIRVGSETFDGHLQRHNDGARKIKAGLSSGDITVSYQD